MEMKRKKISVTSLILPVIMLVVAVILPMIYSTNYYIQLFSQTLINLVAVLGLNVSWVWRARRTSAPSPS